MIDELYKDTVILERYLGTTDTNYPLWHEPEEVKALILGGSNQLVYNKAGDLVSSGIKYRLPFEIAEQSKIDGHVVVSCIRVDSILDAAGYLVRVK